MARSEIESVRRLGTPSLVLLAMLVWVASVVASLLTVGGLFTVAVAVVVGLAAAIAAGKRGEPDDEIVPGLGNPATTSDLEVRQADLAPPETRRERESEAPLVESTPSPEPPTRSPDETKTAEGPRPTEPRPDPRPASRDVQTGVAEPIWHEIRRLSDVLAFPDFATAIDQALADAAEDADPYRVAWTVVETRLDLLPALFDPELIWSYWLDAMHLEWAVGFASSLEDLPEQSRTARLLAGRQADPSRMGLERRAELYRRAYGWSEDAAVAPPQGQLASALVMLLERADEFYRRDDELDVVADGLPILHSLIDLRLLLDAGDSSTRGERLAVRRDLLLGLYVLAQVKLRDLVKVPVNAAAPEDWMPTLDAFAARSEWTQASAFHYAELARLGEQLLRSIRILDWVRDGNAREAAAWARSWREELQTYSLSWAIVRSRAGVDAAG